MPLLIAEVPLPHNKPAMTPVMPRLPQGTKFPQLADSSGTLAFLFSQRFSSAPQPLSYRTLHHHILASTSYSPACGSFGQILQNSTRIVLAIASYLAKKPSRVSTLPALRVPQGSHTSHDLDLTYTTPVLPDYSISGIRGGCSARRLPCSLLSA